MAFRLGRGSGKSSKGSFFWGMLFVILGMVILFRNEGRAVRRDKALHEGGGIVRSVDAAAPKAANEGKLVHVTGRANTEDILKDSLLPPLSEILKIRRIVSMYQWKEVPREETRSKADGGTEKVTVYGYERTWSEELLDSASFVYSRDHANPPAFPLDSREEVAEHILVGSFILPPFLVRKIGGFVPFEIAENVTLPESFLESVLPYEGGLYIGGARNVAESLSSDAALPEVDPRVPEIGDIRVRFEVVPSSDVSIIAMQSGESFAPYVTRGGGSIGMLRRGVISAEDMMERARQENTALTWVLRVVGFLCIFAACKVLFRPLGALGGMVPLVGVFVQKGAGMAALLASLVIGLLTVALAWLWYRPLLGVGLMLLAFLVGLGACRKGHPLTKV